MEMADEKDRDILVAVIQGVGKRMSEYNKKYLSDAGYLIDASNKQKELAEQAIERCYDEQGGKSEEAYMDLLYPNEHDEYLVNGAMLKCDKTTPDVKVLRGKVYNVKSLNEETKLNVSKNSKAMNCQRLHATISDCEIKTNVNPFHCNCSIPPHNDEEWAKLESDNRYLTEGTCGALMKLNGQWDNLPAKTSCMKFPVDMDKEKPGIESDDDYYCIAMAPGFMTRAEAYCIHAEFGYQNFGYKLQIRLSDVNGNSYSMDVVVTDVKGSTDENDLYPHDHIVEFFVDGKQFQRYMLMNMEI